MDTQMTFGTLVRQRRKELGYTMDELAGRVGYSTASIRKIEAGLRRPSRQVAELLAGALGITAGERATFLRLARLSPEHIEQATTPASVSGPPVETAAQAPEPGLPGFLTPLIGRDVELRSVQRRLHDPAVRLLTLTGPGGVGKTRLSMEAAAGMASEFADGVFYLALASVSEAGLVAGTIARALGLKESGSQPAETALKDYLRDRRALLVIDNFEQVVAAAPLLVDLLAAAPGLKMLVTSREALSVRAEHQVPVPPLQLPAPGTSIQELEKNPAVALFAERARSVSDFTLTQENAAYVAAICTRLDGLPLAIELAAARSRLLTPQAMLERFDGAHGPLQLLATGARDLPARHLTLRDAIGWSYDLLDPAEQRTFARLAAFSGEAALEAAQAITCDEGGEKELAGLEVLRSLVDKSLLRQEVAGGDQVRMAMLQVIREYALERLRASGEEDTIRQRHALYYTALAEEAEPTLNGPDQQIWHERLERDHDNLRTALSWAQEHGEWAIAERLAGSVWRFWFRHGHVNEGRRCMEDLLTAVERSGEFLNKAETGRRAKVFHGAGVFAYEQGDYTIARQRFEASAELRRSIGDKAGMAASLTNLGNVALFVGEYERAASLYREAYETTSELGDKWGTAMVVGNAGWGELCRRDYAAAMRLYEKSLALHRELENTWGITKALGSMGWAALYGGDHARAEELAGEALDLARELGDADTESDMLDILGRAAAEQGRREEATRLLGESLELSRKLGDRAGIALCLLAFASMAGSDRDVEGAKQAATLYGAADALSDSTAEFQRAYFERQIKAVRGILDGARWQAAWEEGRAMTLDEAIRYAQEEGVYCRP